MAARHRIAVLSGDGIGPEVTAEAVKVLKTARDRRECPSSSKTPGRRLRDRRHRIAAAARQPGSLPQGARDHVRIGGRPQVGRPPAGAEPERGLLALRKELDLYANLRPAKTFPMLVDSSPLKRSVVEGTDLMVIRELTGGLYFGEPRGIEKFADGGVRAINTMAYTSREIERIARVGFDVARKRRKKLTSVDKANVLIVSQLWRDVVNGSPRTFRT
jgi:3-isopropylmalate dehydrogenase